MSEEKLEEKKEEQEVQKNSELDNTEKELEETVDRLKRVMAEFENYKKRNSKEREMLYSNVLADIIAAFLPVVDNLEKACMADTADENMNR